MPTLAPPKFPLVSCGKAAAVKAQLVPLIEALPNLGPVLPTSLALTVSGMVDDQAKTSGMDSVYAHVDMVTAQSDLGPTATLTVSVTSFNVAP